MSTEKWHSGARASVWARLQSACTASRLAPSRLAHSTCYLPLVSKFQYYAEEKAKYTEEINPDYLFLYLFPSSSFTSLFFFPFAFTFIFSASRFLFQ
jgi:hypothetical protein